MNRNQLILLLVALVVIGGAGLVLVNRHDESWNNSGGKLGEKVLPHFQVNDVAAIHIKGGQDLNLVKKDDRWRVAERADYPANFSDISDLLIKMGDLKIAQDEPIGPSQLARMELGQPGSGAGAGTLLEFKNAQGKVTQSLLLGKKHTRKSERPAMPFGGGEMPDGRYVMLTSDPQDVLTVSDPLSSVEANPANWLNKDFFKVEKPKSIEFVSTNATNSWTLTRASESAEWVLSNPKPGEVLDTNKVSSLSSTLNYPSFVDVAADGAPAKTGMDKPEVVTIKTFDGYTYTLKVGNKTPEGNYHLMVSTTGDFPTERAPEKDEKPDAKKKLDQVFQDNLKVKQDRLKKDQAFDKWTYVVSSWMIDPLVRNRSELMVEKKSEGKDKKEAANAVKSTPDDSSGADLFPPADSGK